MTAIDMESKAIADFKYPFNKDSIVEVWFHCSRSIFNKQVEYDGWVEFKNGKTKGEQHFEASSFPLLVKQIEDFIATL